MKKMLLISLGLLTLAGAAFAGNNVGTMAYLTWSNANHTTTNITSGATNTLFVRLERATAIDFKGAEIDLIWNPTRTADWLGCFERLGSFFNTSAGTTCTYLNRGTNVPVTVADDPNHYHVAWASDLSSTSCTAGNICRIQFETDLCADYGQPDNSGCFTLTSILVLDSNSIIDQGVVAGAVATVDNGTDKCATPVEPTTWGKIKGLYNGN